MSKIVRLDQSYDIWLTYSWSNNNHGICGHLYEVIDYFFILQKHFKVGILLCEDISWDVIDAAIRGKYDFSDDEIATIKSNTTFHNRPRLITGRNILFTDGGVVNTSSVVLLFDNVFYFACGNKEIQYNTQPSVWVLQDDRVYAPVKVNGINYKKRILFSRLKAVHRCDDRALVYATKNCRQFFDFSQLRTYGMDILAVVSDIPTESYDNVTFIRPPVPDIFAKFSTYIYTPVPRKFDCSPRFIAECHHYGKQVIYHNIDYWDIDTGLYWREWDIRNDFSSLALTEHDDIIDIIGSRI